MDYFPHEESTLIGQLKQELAELSAENERLSTYCDNCDCSDKQVSSQCKELADAKATIKLLEEHVGNLRKGLKQAETELADVYNVHCDLVGQMCDDEDKLKSELAALKQAAKDIIDMGGWEDEEDYEATWDSDPTEEAVKLFRKLRLVLEGE